MKEVKDQPAPSTWGDKLVFANLLAEFSSEGSRIGRLNLFLLIVSLIDLSAFAHK